MDTLNIARRVFKTEIDCLKNICENLDETFNRILDEILSCKGKVIITGMGKSGHIARKISASMASLGISSIFVHPGESMHGDLGMYQKEDLVIAISYSGESDEIIRILPSLRIIGCKIVGITSNKDSTLAKKSDIAQIFDEIEEACHLGLAPTTSTTAVLVYGDALAVAASEVIGFSKRDFAIFHPAGSLGKKLTIRTVDLMRRVSENEIVYETSLLSDAILAFNSLGTDIAAVGDENNQLIGILKVSKIKDALNSKSDIYSQGIKKMIEYYPSYVESDMLAYDALNSMIEGGEDSIPVVREGRILGILEKESILKVGIYV